MKKNQLFLIDLEELSALQMDSINGFRQLAERVENPEFKLFFTDNESQSKLLWEDLNKEIIKMNGETKTQGTIKGAINHLWMKLKSDVINSDLENLLDNIEICEEFNISRYKSILSSEPPDHIRELLLRHLGILTPRISRISMLKENLKKVG
jgi:uncharacterized protein (TIGR02284 family)